METGGYLRYLKYTTVVGASGSVPRLSAEWIRRERAVPSVETNQASFTHKRCTWTATNSEKDRQYPLPSEVRCSLNLGQMKGLVFSLWIMSQSQWSQTRQASRDRLISTPATLREEVTTAAGFDCIERSERSTGGSMVRYTRKGVGRILVPSKSSLDGTGLTSGQLETTEPHQVAPVS